MNFESAAIFGHYISKEYAKDIFRLLQTYHNVSASEAASRLNLHVKTVQDFLEAMASLNIVKKEEVYEKKRPYFRYSLTEEKISLEIDLGLLKSDVSHKERLSVKVREKQNAKVRFITARYGQFISSVVVWIGEGRDGKERKINLTEPQGRFMFNLPFPSARPKTIGGIMENAGIEAIHECEIFDIVNLLTDLKVIERDP